MAKLQPFNYDLDFETLNFREHPELYAIGRGEQGVLLVEPYKSEILPHWRFKSPAIARSSAEQIYRRHRKTPSFRWGIYPQRVMNKV